jgi:hypothetical protein
VCARPSAGERRARFEPGALSSPLAGAVLSTPFLHTVPPRLGLAALGNLPEAAPPSQPPQQNRLLPAASPPPARPSPDSRPSLTATQPGHSQRGQGQGVACRRASLLRRQEDHHPHPSKALTQSALGWSLLTVGAESQLQWPMRRFTGGGGFGCHGPRGLPHVSPH